MNKIAKTALMTGTALCVAGVVLSTAGYFAGGKDFTYASDHVYVSGGNSSAHKNLAVMKKEQIDDFTKLNVDFEDLDLDIRTSDDDHYYMEYKLEKNGKKDPLTWEDKDGELTLKESEGGTGAVSYTHLDVYKRQGLCLDSEEKLLEYLAFLKGRCDDPKSEKSQAFQEFMILLERARKIIAAMYQQDEEENGGRCV